MVVTILNREREKEAIEGAEKEVAGLKEYEKRQTSKRERRCELYEKID